MRRLQDFMARMRRDERGVAAIEMGLIGSLFILGLLNVGEIGRYAYTSMEVATATQSSVAAALAACDVAHLPATSNCAGLNAAVDTAVKSTSLGTKVGLSGSLAEAYYCVSDLQKLTYVSTPNSPPADCSAANNPSALPALYLKIATTYTYSPMFPGMTVVDSLPPQISQTAWTRMK